MDLVLHEMDDRGVVTLTLNRPAAFNSLSEAMLEALQAAVRSHVKTRQRGAADRAARERFARLSQREVEVLRLVAQGFVAEEIGARLGISVNTVRTHIRNVYGKLSVNHQGQAVSTAHRLGYL